ncbi:hypothetical protein GCM10010435_51650 [Winogradskya consettensis]|uniref:Uncharacterized protein n=1 Tax=Winogradskya consettensis TaxID=113560 RepID=A0A919SHN8_9ACTN|nr:hypothetical protein [Actinoplanes consettensis]GIM71931.1 hypothetical protein Aco04nite_27780 [Actinoplanes consettensis]
MTSAASFSREFVLSLAIATRVTSLLAIFLGRLDDPFASDTFDPKQGVESGWRELAGMGRSDELDSLLKDRLPVVKERIRASGRPGSAAAAAAIDVITALMTNVHDDAERCSSVAGLALRVAIEMDRAAADLPAEGLSWVAFELRGQAALFDLVTGAAGDFSDEFIDEVRTEAGVGSMAYRNAMRRLPVQ